MEQETRSDLAMPHDYEQWAYPMFFSYLKQPWSSEYADYREQAAGSNWYIDSSNCTRAHGCEEYAIRTYPTPAMISHSASVVLAILLDTENEEVFQLLQKAVTDPLISVPIRLDVYKLITRAHGAISISDVAPIIATLTGIGVLKDTRFECDLRGWGVSTTVEHKNLIYLIGHQFYNYTPEGYDCITFS